MIVKMKTLNLCVLFNNILYTNKIPQHRTETVESLLEHMFHARHGSTSPDGGVSDAKGESVLINGLQVIQTLLEFRKAGYVSIM